MNMQPDSKQTQCILSHDAIIQKIKRIAFQIYEKIEGEDKVFIVGIAPNGYTLAQQIHASLSEICTETVFILCKLEMNKEMLQEPIRTSCSHSQFANETVIVIDDVLNTGKVMAYCIKYFLERPVKAMYTAVLIDRNHKTLPIKIDFKGLSLATEMQDHVELMIDENERFEAHKFM